MQAGYSMGNKQARPQLDEKKLPFCSSQPKGKLVMDKVTRQTKPKKETSLLEAERLSGGFS